jgi:hypothetical protein
MIGNRMTDARGMMILENTTTATRIKDVMIREKVEMTIPEVDEAVEGGSIKKIPKRDKMASN